MEDLEELYAGIRLACSRYGVDLVGGDTSASLTGLCISVTCLGAAREEEIVYRSGAQPTGSHLRQRESRCRLYGTPASGA